MPERTRPQPTLWRTCRALANRTRLRILALLIDDPGQRVTAVAEQLEMSVPAASLNLRALEARGLLQARRSGKYVEYSPVSDADAEPLGELLKALRSQLRRGSGAVDEIFQAATAFTHPRRIELFRQIHAGEADLAQLRRATRISARALHRHAAKLEARHLIRCEGGVFAEKDSSQPVERALVRLALR